jgi:hypothetical protein
MRQATVATSAMNTATDAIVAGSLGLTLNNCACSSRVSPNAAAIPTVQADEREPEPLAEHHAENGASRGAERHVDADLLAALAHRVGEDPVRPDGGKRQRQGGEQPEQLRHESGARHRLPNTSSIVRSLITGSVGSMDWTRPRI